MRKAILITLLTIVSGNAAAGWFAVQGGETATGYVDPSTIRRTGDMAKMWQLLDYKTVQRLPSGQEYMSSKMQFEYDCREERVRVLYHSLHPEPMGNGPVIFTDSDPDKWQPIPPGTPYEDNWKIACGKR